MTLDLHPIIPAIAVPVARRDVAGSVAGAVAAREGGAQLIEWRLDALDPAELAVAAEQLPALRAEAGAPVLATYRSRLEGGPGNLDDDAYGDLLESLVAAGADAIDIELTRGEEVILGPVRLAHEAGITVVGSSHDFSGTPDDLDARFAELARRGSDVLKVAVLAGTDTDVVRLLTSAVRARHELGRAVVPVAMGHLGALTRVGGGLWQAPFTFARVGTGTAPGQLDARAVARVLGVLGGKE